MNRIYKVVWSRARACYVVVSEYAKRTGKSASTKKLLIALAAAGIMAGGAVGMADAAVEIKDGKVTMETDDIAALNTLIQNQSSYVTLTAEKAATLNQLIGKASALMPTAASVGASGSAGITIQTKENKTIPTDWVIESNYSKNYWAYADTSIHTASGVAANDYYTMTKTSQPWTWMGGTNNISLGYATVAGYGLQKYTADDAEVKSGKKQVGDYKKSDTFTLIFPDGSKSETNKVNPPWAYDETKQYSYATAFGVRTAAANLVAMAWGYQAIAAGRYSTAFGDNAIAEGESSLAFGKETKATGDRATAFGEGTTASGVGSAALGDKTKANGKYALAGGSESEASGEGALAWGGKNTKATGKYSAAFNNSTASGASSAAFGSGTASGASSAAFGKGTASGQYALAAGNLTTASGTNSTAIGYNSKATGGASFAGGTSSKASESDSFAFGFNAKATESYAISMGYNTEASGGSSVAIGDEAKASREDSIAIGYKSTSSGNYSVAIGGNYYNASIASGYSSLALVGGKASGSYSVAIGDNAQASGADSFAFGYNSNASGEGAYAIGDESAASGEESLALGYGAKATATKAYAIGDMAEATAQLSLALGETAKATALAGTAIGQNAQVKAAHGTALGTASLVDTAAEYSSALGFGSSVFAENSVGVGGVVRSGAKYGTALGYNATVDTNIEGGVALGANSFAITAKGVTGAYADKKGDQDPAYAWKSTAAAVSIGNVGSGITRQITGVAAGTELTDAVNVAQLKAVAATAEDAATKAGKHSIVTKAADEKNITIDPSTTDGQTTYTVGLAKDLSDINTISNGTSAIALGDGYLALNQNGASIVMMDGMVSLNQRVNVLSDGTIRGVKAGVNDTDAVNVGQLKKAISEGVAAGNTDTHIDASKTYKIENDNSIKLDVVDKDGKAAGTVTIEGVAKSDDVGDVSKLKDDLKNYKTDEQGNKTYTHTSAVDAINKLDDKVDGISGRVDTLEQSAGKHSSVSKGDTNISIDSTKKNTAGGTDYKISLAKDLTVDSVDAGGVKIGKDGIDANGQKITNVADGTAAGDAVNYGQLSAVEKKVDNNTIAINNLSGSVNKLGNRINRVGAGAAALAALHPLDFDPEAKWDFAAGYGNYRGANAAAVGAFYRPNENWMLSLGGSFGGGENMVNAGVSLKVGAGSAHAGTSKAAMAKEIRDLKDVVADQSAEIEELKALVNSLIEANKAK